MAIKKVTAGIRKHAKKARQERASGSYVKHADIQEAANMIKAKKAGLTEDDAIFLTRADDEGILRGKDLQTFRTTVYSTMRDTHKVLVHAVPIPKDKVVKEDMVQVWFNKKSDAKIRNRKS